MSRSGSQKRRLTDQIKVACTPEQKTKVQAIATSAVIRPRRFA